MVNEYEVPLDLILALLSKHQIGIYDINISDLLEQYMAYIRTLRQHTHKPIMQAFRVDTPADLEKAQASSADYILLDSGDGGTGETFDWSLLAGVTRPYFLAGGLDPENVGGAVEKLKPYAVDVSSGIETDGKKDPEKMRSFVRAVRGATGEERDT